MTTTITSNGSKWLGETPDTIEQLIAVLKAHPLDPMHAPYIERSKIRVPGIRAQVRFFGNFRTVSHVFQIRSDDPPIVRKLTRAIQANVASEAHKALLPKELPLTD